MTNCTKLPNQNDLKKVCKGAFEGGASEVRLQIDGLVITVTKKNVDEVTNSPLDHWIRENG